MFKIATACIVSLSSGLAQAFTIECGLELVYAQVKPRYEKRIDESKPVRIDKNFEKQTVVMSKDPLQIGWNLQQVWKESSENEKETLIVTATPKSSLASSQARIQSMQAMELPMEDDTQWNYKEVVTPAGDHKYVYSLGCKRTKEN